MQQSTGRRINILAICVALCAASDASAFKIDTHQVLNQGASEADVSGLDIYLRQQLNFRGGLGEVFDGKQVRQWIIEGGLAEDRFLGTEFLGAVFRSTHHFHDPLLPWDRAGLDALSLCPPFLLSGEASARWAQDPDQGISGRAAWRDARDRFRDGLTLRTTAERDTALARTFKILAQQLHLIADLAVPAHTRNDAHCPFSDGFEAWASDNVLTVQGLTATQPIRPDPTIFTLGVPVLDDIATVPVARLWDSDQYNGTNPDITLSPTIGLAEYTNANFLSDGTVFGEFPFPASTSVELGPAEIEPTGRESRRYFKKVRHGELIDHLAVPSALYDFLPDALKDAKKGFDDKVFVDYAVKLLPRAVGYSAALLDYFFRGRVVIDVSRDQIRIRNDSPEDTMMGWFQLYYDTTDGTRTWLTRWFLRLEPGQDSGVLSSPSVPEASVSTARCLLVFRGVLGHAASGNERDAITGQVAGCPFTLQDPVPAPPFTPPQSPPPVPKFVNYYCAIVDHAIGSSGLPVDYLFTIPVDWDPVAYVQYALQADVDLRGCRLATS